MAQEEAYLDQEGRQPPTGPANLTTSPASPGPSGQQTPHANPSTPGRAAGRVNYDIEVYGPIPSTQVNNYKTNENTNKDMNDSDTTNPTYEKCYNEVKQLPPSLSA